MIVTAITVVFLFFNFFLDTFDMEYLRENGMHVFGDYFDCYILKEKTFFNMAQSNAPGQKDVPSGMAQNFVIFSSIFARKPSHYAVMISGYVFSNVIAIIWFFFSLGYVKSKTTFARRLNLQKVEKILLTVCGCILVVGFAIFGCFMGETLEKNRLMEIAPLHWFFYKSGTKQMMSEHKLQNIIQEYKS